MVRSFPRGSICPPGLGVPVKGGQAWGTGGMGMCGLTKCTELPTPEGAKVPKYGVSGISVLITVVMVRGIYFMFGYLDP